MIDGVLAMYSTPSHPLYRSFGSGLLTQESMKAAGAIASRTNETGWLSILVRSGDMQAIKSLSKVLFIEGYTLNQAYGAALFLLDKGICSKCNGTGVYKWKSGNIRPCKVCMKTGRVPANMTYIAEKAHVPMPELESVVDYILNSEHEAEQSIVGFLSKERSTVC